MIGEAGPLIALGLILIAAGLVAVFGPGRPR